MALWRRKPQLKSYDWLDLKQLPPGAAILVRTGETTHWITVTRQRRLATIQQQNVIVGIASHANDGSALRVAPKDASTDRWLQVGRQLRLGREGMLVAANSTSISTIRAYDLSGVRPENVRQSFRPSSGVDLAQEMPGTVVTLRTNRDGDIHLTLTHPMTHNDADVRGVFVTRRQGTVPHTTPYFCVVNRRLGPGNKVHIREENSTRPLISAIITGVLVDGELRQYQ